MRFLQQGLAPAPALRPSERAPLNAGCRQVVALLDSHGIKYGHFDILQDPTVRAGLKTFSNWPTYPQVPALRARLPSSPLRRRRAAEPPSRSCRAQVYAAGELIGGLDVLNELAEEDGALAEALGAGAAGGAAPAEEGGPVTEELVEARVRAAIAAESVSVRARALSCSRALVLPCSRALVLFSLSLSLSLSHTHTHTHPHTHTPPLPALRCALDVRGARD